MTMDVPENVLAAIIVFVGLQRSFDPDDDDFLVNHYPVLCAWLEALGLLPPTGTEES
jgi:hypothetical protein